MQGSTSDAPPQQRRKLTFLGDVALPPSRQSNHYHADSRVFHLHAEPVSLSRHVCYSLFSSTQGRNVEENRLNHEKRNEAASLGKEQPNSENVEFRVTQPTASVNVR